MKKSKNSMPQLDKVTFLSQYFWLFIFFFGFYIYVSKFFLPRLIRVYLLRQRVLNSENASVSSSNVSSNSSFPIPAKEISKESLQELANTVYSRASAIGKKKSLEYSVNLPTWAEGALSEIDKKFLADFYGAYFHSLSVRSLSKALSFYYVLPESQKFNHINLDYIKNSSTLTKDLQAYLGGSSLKK